MSEYAAIKTAAPATHCRSNPVSGRHLQRQPSCQAIGIRRRFSSRLLTRSNEAELEFQSGRTYRAVKKGKTGAPRPTKMGNIVSPWRYDAAARHALQ
jgi:hypothetical protein